MVTHKAALYKTRILKLTNRLSNAKTPSRFYLEYPLPAIVAYGMTFDFVAGFWQFPKLVCARERQFVQIP
jgi:hypothetical protein